MRQVDALEPDDSLNPEKREVGCKTRHPEHVRQGPSTAIGVHDLRSKQGEFQSITMKPLRHSTACSTGLGLAAARAVTTLDGSANLTLLGPVSPLGHTCHMPPLPTVGLPSLSNWWHGTSCPRHPHPWRFHTARPDLEAVRQEPSSLHSSPWLEKMYTIQLLQ